MKKYLIKGLLALVVGGFTASCADKDGEYVPMDQQKEAAYAEVFKELIGGEVAPNHDWGFKKTSLLEDFSQTRAMSRAMTRGDSDCGTCWKYDQQYDTPSFPKTGHPAAITDSERAFVKNWFETNPGLSEVGLDIQNFYLQHVWGQANKNYNIKTEETGATDVNQGTMDYCEVGDGTNFTHVLDFNANSGGTWGIVYMRNSSALSFGFHATWGDNRDYHNFKLAHIVGTAEDGTKIDGYYVGLAMWGQKWDNGTKTLNYDQWQYADDWILKIVPGEGETSNTTTTTRTDRIERRRLVSQGRVFCEDLGTDVVKMDLTDIDFNDAVFDAKIWRMGQFDIQYKDNTYNSESDYLENIYTTGINGFDITTTGGDAHVIVNGKFKYVAEICILAAGGTIPLRIGGNNGFEIHEKFGVGHTTVVNTMGDPSIEQFKAMINHTTHDAVTINVDITDIVRNEVENNNTDISLDIIPVEVLWKNGEYQGVSVLQAGSVGSVEDIRIAPKKLCVPISTPWVYERIPIIDAYDDFADYAKDKTPLFWEESEESTNRNPSLLYPSIEGEMVALEGETGNVNTNPYDDNIVIPGTTTTTTVTETVLWEGNNAYSEGGGNGTDMTLYSKDFSANNYVRVYATINTSNPSNVQFEIKDDPNWNTIMLFQASDYNYEGGYFEKQVDSNFINYLTTTIHSWGRDCTITKICKVVTTTN